MSPHLNILCTISIKENHTEITINLSDNVYFFFVFRLQFTINTNFVHMYVEMEFSMPIIYLRHYGQCFWQLIYRSVYCVRSLAHFLPRDAMLARY